MIADHDRSGYIGASDVRFVIGNWKTKTWEKWWLQKLGINTDHFENQYTIAGTNWEHRILESLNLPDLELDKQIFIEDLKLRVNLDGNTSSRIKEVKTYKLENGYKNPKYHIQQTHVQVFAARMSGFDFGGADIVTYGLEPADYDNFFRDIDPDRRKEIPVTYNQQWADEIFLPKLLILADCLRKGVFPNC